MCVPIQVQGGLLASPHGYLDLPVQTPGKQTVTSGVTSAGIDTPRHPAQNKLPVYLAHSHLDVLSSATFDGESDYR